MQFRKWAAGSFEQFTIKAYVMDDDRMLQSLDLLNKSKGADKRSTHYVFDSFLGIFHGGYRSISHKRFRLKSETEHCASHNQSLFVLLLEPVLMFPKLQFVHTLRN